MTRGGTQRSCRGVPFGSVSDQRVGRRVIQYGAVLGDGHPNRALTARSQPPATVAVDGMASVSSVRAPSHLADGRRRPAAASLVRRTREVNRRLLGSPVIRPVLLTLWVPNGLIVGAEALFVPFAGPRAAYLFAASAAGMLLGDVVVGRFVPVRVRDRLIGPLRLLLAAPYLAFPLVPAVPAAAALAFVASVGYSASLPLQERLVDRTDAGARGQVFGLNGTGLMVGQALGALLGGLVAQLLGVGPQAAAQAMALMALASVAATVVLTPGLRRSRTPVVQEAGANL